MNYNGIKLKELPGISHSLGTSLHSKRVQFNSIKGCIKVRQDGLLSVFRCWNVQGRVIKMYTGSIKDYRRPSVNLMWEAETNGMETVKRTGR